MLRFKKTVSKTIVARRYAATVVLAIFFSLPLLAQDDTGHHFYGAADVYFTSTNSDRLCHWLGIMEVERFAVTVGNGDGWRYTIPQVRPAEYADYWCTLPRFEGWSRWRGLALRSGLVSMDWEQAQVSFTVLPRHASTRALFGSPKNIFNASYALGVTLDFVQVQRVGRGLVITVSDTEHWK